jgi:hypothetical protein
VSQGLSDPHASVLAAIRIRLKRDPGRSLEDLLEAAGDLESKPKLDSLMAEKKPKPELDSLLAAEKPKRSLDDLLGQEEKGPKNWPS